MSTERSERIPELTLGWRLKMSLGEMSRDRIAEMMDVTPSTISRWMADKGAPPKRPYLLQWAFVTGVPVEWLESGNSGSATPPDGPGGGRKDKLTRLTEAKKARVRSTDQYFVPTPIAA